MNGFLKWLFRKNKKDVLHRAYDELPYFSREVVVQRELLRVPPFSAYLSCKDGKLYWKGTCGEKKDKFITLLSDDNWRYC